MALIEGPACPFGHGPDCRGHTLAPVLTGFPNADPPKAGRCRCGEVNYLWPIPNPAFAGYYCKACIRRAMRVGTYPETIRFPDEVV